METVAAVVGCTSYRYRRRQLLFSAIGFLSSVINSPFTEANCHEEQITACRNAAQEVKLSSLQSGGVCKAQQYLDFSHSCTVTNYLPTVDYCCCVYDTLVMCCRYHQTYNHYRCQSDDDVIDTVNNALPPLSVLLPSIILPLMFVLCCATVAFRAWRRRRRESKQSQRPCPGGIGAIKGRGSGDQESSPQNHSTHIPASHPNSTTSGLYHTDSEYLTLGSPTHSQGRGVTEPSAPPLSDLHYDQTSLHGYLTSEHLPHSYNTSHLGDRILLPHHPLISHHPTGSDLRVGSNGSIPQIGSIGFDSSYPTSPGFCSGCSCTQYTVPPPPYQERAVPLPRYEDSVVPHPTRTLAGRLRMNER